MKFTPEVQQRLLAAVSNGCFRYQACAAAGITRKTLRQWEKLAERDLDGEHAEFVDRLHLAQDRAEARLMMLHYALATGAPLPQELLQTLRGALGRFHQDALLPALEFQLTSGGTRPWAEMRQVEHSEPPLHAHAKRKEWGTVEVAAGPIQREAATLLRDDARPALAHGGACP